jgi:hypothetical protein
MAEQLVRAIEQMDDHGFTPHCQALALRRSGPMF